MCNWLPVSTFFNQLWEDVDELLAGISGVQLRYLVEHHSPIVECENSVNTSQDHLLYNSPGLDLCGSIVDSWNGLTTVQRNKHSSHSMKYEKASYVFTSISPSSLRVVLYHYMQELSILTARSSWQGQ